MKYFILNAMSENKKGGLPGRAEGRILHSHCQGLGSTPGQGTGLLPQHGEKGKRGNKKGKAFLM